MRSEPLLLLLLAIATAADGASDTSYECPDTDWIFYSDQYEATCLKLMPTLRLFAEASETCSKLKSRLLSLLHKHSKILFVNDLILASGSTGEKRHALWFSDPVDTDKSIEGVQWLVVSPNADPSKIELQVNMTVVPRSFICEAPARPKEQRPWMEREPEDTLISNDLVVQLPRASDSGTKTATNVSSRATDTGAFPFVVTFDCEAIGAPKPTVTWTLVIGDDHVFSLEPIKATVIHSPHLPIDQSDLALQNLLFFDLQHDCKSEACPTVNSFRESSQLIVVNPQLLLSDGKKRRIACVASNDFGSVLSREAQLIPAQIGHFANQSVELLATTGLPSRVTNAIVAQPDAAAIECFRVLDTGQASVSLVPMEQVNRATGGGLQLSRATFDFIVDAASPEDAGRYLCQASVPNGRLGHITRERTLVINVQPCQQPVCNLTSKPVSVVPGYPVVLSLNPFSSRLIRHGDSFLLECPCIGKRHPTEEMLVEWNLNNRADLAAVVLPALPQGSALLLTEADYLRHSGLYECRCHRGAAVSAWRSVYVNILPSLAPLRWNQEPVLRARVGENINLDCRVDSVKDVVAVTVQPLLQTRPLASSARLKLNRLSPGQFKLSIFNVTMTDADVFGCRVVSSFSSGLLDVRTYYKTIVVHPVVS